MATVQAIPSFHFGLCFATLAAPKTPKGFVFGRPHANVHARGARAVLCHAAAAGSRTHRRGPTAEGLAEPRTFGGPRLEGAHCEAPMVGGGEVSNSPRAGGRGPMIG